MYATDFGNLRSVKVLVAAGADVNVGRRNGATPIFWAANGPSEVLSWLLEHGASHNPGSVARSPLIVAAKFGELENVRALLDRGADVNAADDRGTPLIHAVGSDQGRTGDRQAAARSRRQSERRDQTVRGLYPRADCRGWQRRCERADARSTARRIRDRADAHCRRGQAEARGAAASRQRDRTNEPRDGSDGHRQERRVARAQQPYLDQASGLRILSSPVAACRRVRAGARARLRREQ